jgi:hypothetical protein
MGAVKSGLCWNAWLAQIHAHDGFEASESRSLTDRKMEIGWVLFSAAILQANRQTSQLDRDCESLIASTWVHAYDIRRPRERGARLMLEGRKEGCRSARLVCRSQEAANRLMGLKGSFFAYRIRLVSSPHG